MVRGVRITKTAHVEVIRNWVDRIDRAVGGLMPLHACLNRLPGARRHKRALMLLSTSCLGMSGDILELVHGCRLWGAELVMRAVIEGTAKFGYLLESRDTYTSRCIEYRDALPLIARRRRHFKASEALKALASVDVEGSQAYRDLLLAPEELSEIDAAYPRAERVRLEKRWGFGALVDAVAKPTGAFGPAARTLLHGYSTASDLQHMTYEGTDMPLERDQRDPQRKEAIEASHAAKLLSDAYYLTWLRINAALRFTGQPLDELAASHKLHAALLNELKQVQRHWERLEYGRGPSPT